MTHKLTQSKSVLSLQVSQINHLDPVESQANQQHHFTFESHSQQCRAIHTEKDEDTEHSDCKAQVEKQYKMRIGSIVKGYEVKISREQETFELKQLKYVQEIQYLKRQLKELCNINKETKVQNNEQHCSLCSNGDVINFMKNMLDAVQNDHRGCLTEKSVLNAKVIALQQKVLILQNQNEETESRYTKAKLQIKQHKMEKQNLQREKRQKQKQIRDMEREYQMKEMVLEQEVSKHKLAQKDLQAQIKKVQLKYLQTINQMKEEKSKSIDSYKQKQPLRQFKREQYREQIPRDYFKQCTQSQFYRQQEPTPQNSQIYSYETYQKPIININRESQIYLPPPKIDQHVQKPPSQKMRLFFNQSKVQARQPLKSNIIMSNINMTGGHWKSKIDESYVEYVNNKRKNNKIESKSGVFSATACDTFETFRPRPGYPTDKAILNNKGVSRQSKPLKYSYLQR